MGKAKALRLGIVKGIKHNVETVVNKSAAFVSRPYVGHLIGKLKCTACGHPSNSHSRRRPKFEGWDAQRLLEAIESTGSRGSGGFMECSFYFCDDCKVDVLEVARKGQLAPSPAMLTSVFSHSGKQDDDSLKECPI